MELYLEESISSLSLKKSGDSPDQIVHLYSQEDFMIGMVKNSTNLISKTMARVTISQMFSISLFSYKYSI
jgi:hypothetical protein